jgi:ComF family protein
VITAWLGALERLVLPPTCLLCGAAGVGGQDLCAGCADDLPRNLAACPRCASPLPAGGTGPCARCRAQPPDFDRALVAFRYQPPVDVLITRLKFNGRLACARLLGELFAAALAERGDPAPDCIVPVPLHPRRLRERGFNQSVELARPVACRLGVPLRIDGLRRVRHTLPQVRLDARQRQTNPLGAFALGTPLPETRIALLDDVVTTASTIGECARVLRTGGATDITIWAIGRAGGAP